MDKRLATFGTVPMGVMGDRVPFAGGDDPLGIMQLYLAAYKAPGTFGQGVVLTYNPQTHSAYVKMNGLQARDIWTCFIADERLSYAFGFSETHPPREGELVLVLRIDPSVDAGIIIGRIPYRWDMSAGDMYNDPDGYHRRLFTQRSGTVDDDITCYTEPLLNPDDDSTHNCNHFRPTDIYPGEFANLNQHNCGIKGGLFSATLLGGGASLRMSALTNAARLVCESYMRYSLYGSLHEFHNGRYLSSERNVAMYQEERLGGVGPRAKVWTEDSKAPAGGEDQTIRPRIKDLSGYFGHLVSKFCLRPSPKEDTESGVRVQQPDMPIDGGVSRETIDPSGQYRLSAAGMLAIERTGRIPVPVRRAYPTDKGHDIPTTPAVLTPFEHDDSDPAYRQLELFDRQAYDLKNQYARVDGIGESDPDYDVPQEEDMDPLEDRYDEEFYGNETVKLKKFDKRRAGVYIGEDGSVIVRDAWGSEIVMLGGNVSISCAGNVMMLPGKTQLTIAGDDIVQKAQNSVDIHASKHDVRLSAARNMEILGGADDKNFSGGVVIESRGNMGAAWDGSQGENSQLSGVTIKASNQRVVINGKRVDMRSEEDTRIVSGGKEVDGSVSIGAKTLKVRSDVYMSNGVANLWLSEGVVEASGQTVMMAAENTVNITKGNEALVPLKWQSIGNHNPASDAIASMDKATTDMSNEKTASDGMGREELEKMSFGFRSSEQCGTDKSWTMGAHGKFTMYEPAWIQVMKVYETLTSEAVDATAYEEKAEWKNGRPFPGSSAENDGKYAELKGLKPANLNDSGFNKSRKNVEDRSSITTKPLKEGYLVRKQ